MNQEKQYRYVLGFLFNTGHRDRVWLINKNRPSWQRGKLNGIGGHIEAGETPEEAMRREFREEAGLDVPYWQHAVTLHNCANVEMFVFRAFMIDKRFMQVKQTTDERPQCFFVHKVNTRHHPVLPNLDWMVPLLLDKGLVMPIEIHDMVMPGD